MKDIELARQRLIECDLNFVLVKSGEILDESDARGIKPILNIYNSNPLLLKDGAVADRVIGRAAAIFLKKTEIKYLHTVLISQDALDILENTDIEIIYDELVPRILNRDKTDLCPMEKLSQDTDDADILSKKIVNFFEGVK